MNVAYAGDRPLSAASSYGDIGRETRRLNVNLPTLSLVESGEPIRRVDSVASTAALAVVYPDIGEPYRGIFARIIDGIEKGAKAPVRSYPIASDQDSAELNAQLKRSGTKVVIALGRQGLRATAGLDRDIQIVVGGVLSVPESETRSLMG
ncbi:MAG TPA: hypothetical protein VM571_03780, partial [Noviherbaspirillum sp.]|nr:hypothetical protein [Noviherbaspirillum sp.]